MQHLSTSQLYILNWHIISKPLKNTQFIELPYKENDFKKSPKQNTQGVLKFWDQFTRQSQQTS